MGRSVFPESVRQRLHGAWLERLRAKWRLTNTLRLGGALQQPVFAIDCGVARRLGQWNKLGRLLSVSEEHILTAPWLEVEKTLLHEMAHQYVDEVLQVAGETAHGPAFAQACEKIGVTPEATAKKSAADGAEIDKVLQKVQKLLALAESQNVHEAEAAMAAANRLLLEYNIDVQQARKQNEYGNRRIGKAAAAISIDAKLVGGILAEFFFVECLWVSQYNAILDRDERILEIMGTPTNLELAAYVHDFLHHAVARHWAVARGKLGRGDISTKREFSAGMLTGFTAKLRAERKGSAERGLVWVGDPALKGYVRQRYPRVSSMASSAGWHASDAHAAGRAAGQNLQIHRGVTHHGAGGRLLGSS